MALIGLPTAFIGAVVADMRGDDRTRSLARTGFGAIILYEIGFLTGVVTFGGDVMGVLAGFIGSFA